MPLTKIKRTKQIMINYPRVDSVSNLVDIAGHMPPKRVVIAGGDREEDLRLVESARDHGIVNECLLVGNGTRISKAAEIIGIEISRKSIIATRSQEETAAKTIGLAQAGKVDMILKGNISTPILNREILKIKVKNTIGLVTMFDAAPLANGRPMFITDPGVTTDCNYGRMIDLIENAAEVARVVGGIERPRVALISANEKVIPSLRSTVLEAELTRKHWDKMVVYGPLSFDLATDMNSVAVKTLPNIKAAMEVAGRADVLVCPGIDTANAVYKTIMAMVKFGEASMAGITVGVAVPYIILSRADPVETKLDSIALCCIYAERIKNQKVVQVHAKSKRKTYKILTVNPGSTSTKLAVFANQECLAETEILHPSSRLLGSNIDKEIRQRVEIADRFLRDNNLDRVDAVVGRGGFLNRPSGKLAGGTYLIAEKNGRNVQIQKDIIKGVTEYSEMDHASNLGIPMAAEFAMRFKVPAYTVDPVVVDEFCPEAEVSGYAPIRRESTSHALSVRAAIRKYAEDNNRRVEDVNIVVAHLGGGITVAAVKNGKMVDNSIALLGEGPFTPQRAGTLPQKELIDLCYSGMFSRDELIEELTKRGGLQSYLGDHRVEEILKRNDMKSRLIIEAMIYQISKEIGAMSVVVGSRLEAIVLTGGMVRAGTLVRALRNKVSILAPVVVFSESLEMAAMALGAHRVLSGQEKVSKYTLRKRRKR